MKIQKVKRKDLDIEKYSNALNASLNYRIYAEYWYLDILTNEKWECLIYGDYEVIMPIPLQFKLGFKFVLQPILCQQLGVFYRDEISKELFSEFEKKLHSYRVRAYHFNEENTERFQPIGEKRVNHVLDLNRSYNEIAENFRKNRKYDIKQFPKYDFKAETSDDIKSVIDLAFDEYPVYEKLAKKEKLIDFFNVLNHKGKMTLLKAFSPTQLENKAFRVILQSNNRKILILAVRNKEFRTVALDTLLVNSIISEFSETKTILDFEGSSLKGIAEYNMSYGAKESYFTVFSNFSFPS